MSQLEDNVTPIFILGLPRTGTTLLHSLLDSHPHLLVDAGESRFFRSFYKKAKTLSISQQLKLADEHLLYLFNPENQYYKKYLPHISSEFIKENFHCRIMRTSKRPQDFLESYIFSYGYVSGTLSPETKYWVEKTPFNEFYLDKLTTWWPHAKYIHMFRDPRDVYASIYTRDIRNWRKLTKPESLAYTWLRSFYSCNKYQNKIGSGKYLVIRYEDLVNELENTLSKIISFLEIKDNACLRKPTKAGGKVEWKGNKATGDKFSGVEKSAINRWRTILPPEHVLEIERLLFPEMIKLQYSPLNKITYKRLPLIFLIKKLLRDIKFISENL